MVVKLKEKKRLKVQVKPTDNLLVASSHKLLDLRIKVLFRMILYDFIINLWIIFKI